jgi:hypothetical protein
MADAEHIRKLIRQAAPNSGQVEPRLRRPQSEIRAAQCELSKIARNDPDGFLLTILEKRLPVSYVKTIVSKDLEDRHFDMLVERLKLASGSLWL